MSMLGNSLGQCPSVWLLQHFGSIQLIDGSEQRLLGMFDFASQSKTAVSPWTPLPPSAPLPLPAAPSGMEWGAGCYVGDRI